MKIVDADDGVILELYAQADENEIFLPGAGRASLGKHLPIHFGDIEIVGVIVSAEVVDHGKSLKIGVKLDEMPSKLRRTLEN